VKTSFRIVPNHIVNNEDGTSEECVYPGDVIDILIGFENVGDFDLYITDVCGSLTSSYDFTEYLRNFTAIHQNVTVKPSEHHTLNYPLLLDDRTNPIKFGILVAVFFEDNSGKQYNCLILFIFLCVYLYYSSLMFHVF
jgi:hypothetical protein